jgi:hypothetical protein
MLHVPVLRVFTEEPLTLQIFLDETATLISNFDVDAILIFALVAKHARVIVLPFLTEQFAAATTMLLGIVVVGGVVVDVDVDVDVVAALQGE